MGLSTTCEGWGAHGASVEKVVVLLTTISPDGVELAGRICGQSNTRNRQEGVEQLLTLDSRSVDVGRG